jgi:uncharacterized protein YacL
MEDDSMIPACVTSFVISFLYLLFCLLSRTNVDNLFGNIVSIIIVSALISLIIGGVGANILMSYIRPHIKSRIMEWICTILCTVAISYLFLLLFKACDGTGSTKEGDEYLEENVERKEPAW